PLAARMLICFTVIVWTLPLPTSAAPPVEPMRSEHLVYLACDLPDEQLIVLGATLAAWRPSSVLLLDSSKASPYLKSFLTSYKADQIIPIGGDADYIADLVSRLGIKPTAPMACSHGQPLALWRSLFKRAEEVVVCPIHPRGTLLQAACLAAA